MLRLPLSYTVLTDDTNFRAVSHHRAPHRHRAPATARHAPAAARHGGDIRCACIGSNFNISYLSKLPSLKLHTGPVTLRKAVQ